MIALLLLWDSLYSNSDSASAVLRLLRKSFCENFVRNFLFLRKFLETNNTNNNNNRTLLGRW